MAGSEPQDERARLARRDPLLRGWLRRVRACPPASRLVLRGSLLLDALSPGARPARDVDHVWPDAFDPAACDAVVRAVLATPDPVPLAQVDSEVIFAETPWPGWRVHLASGDEHVQVDLASGDPFSTPPVMTEIRDVGPVRCARAETLFAWKLHGLVERGRGQWRGKDLYDLWILVENVPMQPELLRPAIELAFSSRHTPLEMLDDFLSRQGWGESRSGQRKWRALGRSVTPPAFHVAREAVRHFLAR